MHLDALGWTSGTMRRGYRLAVDTIVVIMVVMGGRVIPSFTQSAIPGIEVARRVAIEYLALGATLLYLVSDFIDERSLAAQTTAIGMEG